MQKYQFAKVSNCLIGGKFEKDPVMCLAGLSRVTLPRLGRSSDLQAQWSVHSRPRKLPTFDSKQMSVSAVRTLASLLIALEGQMEPLFFVSQLL